MRGVERFRRVKEEEVEVDERVNDNSFDAKVSVHGALDRASMLRKREENGGRLLDTIEALGRVFALS